VELTATFADVGDLVVDHAVQVADVRVGRVSRIELTDDFHALVTLEVKDELELPDDSIAVLRQTSLLGEKFVELRPRRDGDECEDPAPTTDGVLVDGDTVTCALEAPELEVVAESAVGLLGAVVTNDLRTIIETGSAGFGGRGEELLSIIEDLSSISATLASQTTNLVSIIDGLGSATQTIAAGAPALDEMLLNLADATTVLAEERDQAVATLSSLTRLARTQNDLVFEPYLDATTRQIEELDAILAQVNTGRAEVGTLLDWVAEFIRVGPLAIPCENGQVSATETCLGGSFAQVYGWFAVAPLDPGAPG
jgi:phospholipid/cholesterol/gamma-HCH transport system substrate-binding protein